MIRALIVAVLVSCSALITFWTSTMALSQGVPATAVVIPAETAEVSTEIVVASVGQPLSAQ